MNDRHDPRPPRRPDKNHLTAEQRRFLRGLRRMFTARYGRPPTSAELESYLGRLIAGAACPDDIGGMPWQ